MGLIFNKNNQHKIQITNLPKHIGIIMDGNGRWAKKRGLPRSFGHRAGAKNFRTITKYCSNIGIKHLTVFAFSTENWKRPFGEINSLMHLFKQYLEESLSDFKNENIKVGFLGNRDHFSEDIKILIKKVEECSKKNDGMILNIAMDYGGRAEIINAVKLIAKNVVDGKLEISQITEDIFSKLLYTEDQPDVDLVIRSSGEFRTSNFLIWQSAYAEYVVTDVLWPDFKTNDLDRVLKIYSNRNRRFGGV